MKPVESITKSLAKELDKLNNIREDSLRLSREIIRSCSKSIRNVHRNELKDAKTYLKEAEKKNTQLKNSLKNSPELRFAGYIVEAEKELVEASLVYEYELNGEILPYKSMDVSASSYIQGIGDAIGNVFKPSGSPRASLARGAVTLGLQVFGAKKAADLTQKAYDSTLGPTKGMTPPTKKKDDKKVLLPFGDKKKKKLDFKNYTFSLSGDSRDNKKNKKDKK